MHRCTSPENLAAIRLSDALVAEANAEDRNRRADLSHNIGGNAGLLWCARPRRDDDMRGCQSKDLVDADGIVPSDQRRLTQLADIAGKVVDEGVVVVDEENHWMTNVSINPRALSNVSLYSSSGSESATIPPPAWKYTCPFRSTYVRMTMLVSMAPVALR